MPPMPAKDASRTALGTAGLRAAHRLLDAPPWILDDFVAERLLGPAGMARLQAGRSHLQSPLGQALRAHVLLRSRVCEDRLRAATERGLRRLVILGAGFDTFAFRQPDWARGLSIVEVDHPQSQAQKREHLEWAGLAPPENLAFLALDLEREPLPAALARLGFTRDEPVFFSWLGVSMYLPEAAVVATLRVLASFASGSETVLTFLPPEDTGSGLLDLLVGAAGEPFRSRFAPEAMARILGEAGFSQVHLPTREEVAERYFRDRPRDLPVPRRVGIAWAVV